MKTEYAPRPGSKVAQAAEALRNGPLPAAKLATVMNTDSGSVNVLLAVAVENDYIVKVADKANVLHYALGGMKLDSGFKPYESTPLHARGSDIADVPVVRKVESPSVTPSAAALAAAAPFGSGRRQDVGQAGRGNAQAGHAEKPAESKRVISAAGRESGFAAGLFSSGELVITAGPETIKLCPEHTRALFRYLDKIAGAIEA